MNFQSYGVRLSYARFLADMAGGMVFLLFALLAYQANVYVIGVAPIQTIIEPPDLDTGGQATLGVALLLLSAPLGLAINAAGWFLLGQMSIHGVDQWFRKKRAWRWLWNGTEREFYASDLIKRFPLLNDGAALQGDGGFPLLDVLDDDAAARRSENEKKGDEKFEKISCLEQLIRQCFPAIYEQFSFLSGIDSFIRSLALLFLLTCIYVILVYAQLAAQLAIPWDSADRILPVLSLPLLLFLVILLLWVLSLRYWLTISILVIAYMAGAALTEDSYYLVDETTIHTWRTLSVFGASASGFLFAMAISRLLEVYKALTVLQNVSLLCGEKYLCSMDQASRALLNTAERYKSLRAE